MSTALRVMPEVSDVVSGSDGFRGIVRAVHPSGHVKVAAHGDHDEGVWVRTDEMTVVYREGATPLRDKPRTAAYRKPRPQTTRSIKVHEDVMRAALGLAGGDASRLQIVDETTVYVR